MELSGLLLLILTTALFAAIGIRYSRNRQVSLEDFISARNSAGFGATFATLVASGMGAWILFSPAEAAITGGITALIGYALSSACALFVYAWLGQRLRKMMPAGHSIAEYVFYRFGAGMSLLALLITAFYMSVFLTAELTGIALAVQMAFGVAPGITAAVIGVGTLTYTAVGGLRASIFTDRIQNWLILPLLALVFLGSLFFLGGVQPVAGRITQNAPQLLDLRSPAGIEYGATLLIAIVSAELFNQANWQRVYVAQTTRTMRRSFLTAGFTVLPIILAVGMFGFFAVGTGAADTPSVALIAFIIAATPTWILLVTMVLGITLVMSSMDTMLNGLVSLFTVDLARLRPQLEQQRLLRHARWLTVLPAVPAMLVATQGYSVLYLFLVADLVCAAAVFPTYYGLFARRFSGTAAMLATLVGIIAGAFYFPDPTFSRGSLFQSFLIAFTVPALLSLLLGQLHLGERFDFQRLKERVVALGE